MNVQNSQAIAPRDYQTRTFETLLDRMRHGIRRILAVSPCGSGKTILAAMLLQRAAAVGMPAYFLAHRRELVDQASEKLTRFGVPHGVIMGGRSNRQADAPIQVASVQTVIKRGLPSTSLLCLDEARLHLAAGSRELLKSAGDPFVVGLDGSPVRTDGQGLGEIFDDIVLMARIGELVAAGHLCDYEGFSYLSDDFDLSTVALKGNDFDPKALLKRMGRRTVVGNIVERWHAGSPGRRTVVFAVSKAHSRSIVDEFNAARHHGAPIAVAEHVDDQTSSKDRAAALQRIATGETTILSNVDLLGYGVDIPPLETVILARPTLSLSVYLQQVWRAGRPSPATGKTTFRIHDHAGNMMLHGLPDAEREWSLDAVPRALADGQEVDACPGCGKAMRRGAICCAACSGLSGEREPIAVKGEGREIQVSDMRAVPSDKQREELRKLVTTAHASRQSTGWVIEKFQAQFGTLTNWRWF